MSGQIYLVTIKIVFLGAISKRVLQKLLDVILRYFVVRQVVFYTQLFRMKRYNGDTEQIKSIFFKSIIYIHIL